MSNKLRISGYVNNSIVDGPGMRFTLFTQGCPHHCEGCHNPQTHDFKGGRKAKITEIWKEIDKNPLLSGVTFSGGEPFMQAKALIPLAQKIKERGLELACYTGFTFEQLTTDMLPGARELLSYVDIVIDGKFILAQRSLDLMFKGSLNQRTINVQQSLKEGKVVLETSNRWTKKEGEAKQPKPIKVQKTKTEKVVKTKSIKNFSTPKVAIQMEQ